MNEEKYGTPVNELPVHDLKINKLESMMQKLTLVTVGDQPNIDLGISEIKKLIKAIKELEEARAIVMEDGKVTLGDFTGHPIEVLWQPAAAIFDVLKTKDLLASQILRVDVNEAEELIAEIAKEFDMVPKDVINKLGHALKAAWHIGEIFKL